MVGSRTGDRIRREIDPATTIGAVLPLAALVISLSSWPTQALKSLAVGVAGLGPLIMAIGLGGRFSFLVQVRANVLFVFLWIALIVLLWERNRDGAVALLAVPPSSVSAQLRRSSGWSSRPGEPHVSPWVWPWMRPWMPPAHMLVSLAAESCHAKVQPRGC